MHRLAESGIYDGGNGVETARSYSLICLRRGDLGTLTRPRKEEEEGGIREGDLKERKKGLLWG